MSLAEAVTVDQSVREDITAHPSFNLTIVNAARDKLANMDEADRKFFDFLSPDEFLRGTPKSTVWWVQRAMFLLSHRRQQGRWVRYSFATWLVPFVEKHVLHNDVIASITMRGYHALLALNDPVAAAWRSDPQPGARNWAGRLAQIAGCKRSTVYNRRDELWRTYRVDIAYPLQMYSDILYYGSNSIAKPESITALMVAVKQRRGGKVVRLHADAIADFERKRVKILNPALVSRPRAMELNLPPIALPARDDLKNDPAFVDFADLDLDEAVSTTPVSARPPVAVGHGLATKVGRKTIFMARRSPPPPTRTKTILMRTRTSPPPPIEKKVIVMRARTSPPPAPTMKRLRLHVPPSPPPAPPVKKLRLRRMYSPPPTTRRKFIVMRARTST